MGFKKPTRFLEELCQDVIVWFLPVLRLIVFTLCFLTGPFLHQVRDAVTFKPSILVVFAFLMFMFVRVSGVAVLSLFPVFLWAGQGRVFVSVLVRAGWVWVFDCWLGRIPVSVILSRMRCICWKIWPYIQAILVSALTVRWDIWFTRRVFTARRSVSISWCRNVCWGVSAVCTSSILVCRGVFLYMAAMV